MKPPRFDHQDTAFNLLADREYFALFMEMGTGKTRVIIDDAERLHNENRITGMLVIAPSGVHRNWVDELVKHMAINYRVTYWRSTATKKFQRELDDLMIPIPEVLTVFTMNIEALYTKRGQAAATQFLTTHRTIMVIDESSRIKNMRAAQTKTALKLAPLTTYRRILTGTPMTQSPMDLYAQMQFLSKTILDNASFVAFRAKYADVKLNNRATGFIENTIFDELADRDIFYSQIRHELGQGNLVTKTYVSRGQGEAMIQVSKRGRGHLVFTFNINRISFTVIKTINFNIYPEIAAYRQVEALRDIIAQHSFRVLKRECLDLPEKLYTKVYITLTPEQRKHYKELSEKLKTEILHGEVTVAIALTKLLRLQQLVGGFLTTDEGEVIPIKSNRLAALMDILEDLPGKVIIWARFRAELAAIEQALIERYGKESVISYHGGVSSDQRKENIDRFQNDETCRFFNGNQHSGGLGITLTAASTTVYFSNDFSLETRLQSEDRNHRIGTKHNVTYIDMVAEDTVDEKVVEALRNKKNLADMITGDQIKTWL